MSKRIKDCPFCGWVMDDEYENQIADIGIDSPKFIIVCPDCVASTTEETTIEKAIAKWNMRVEKEGE